MPAHITTSGSHKLQAVMARCHDPLRLMVHQEPKQISRIVLRAVCFLISVMVVWALFGRLDIIASAQGKLVPKTLVKIVQPAESGVLKELLVNEGDVVKAGQVLARLDTTLALADKDSIHSDLLRQLMQERRIVAELGGAALLPKDDDDAALFAQIKNQYTAHRRAFLDGVDQEKSLLSKAENERRSALQILQKLQQSLPVYQRSAQAYQSLEKQGFFSPLATEDKQREVIAMTRDIAAQQATVAALEDTILAQKKRVQQFSSHYYSDLERELAEVRTKMAQLQPMLDKTLYREGLMVLSAPQDGVIQNLSTTTLGAVVQPGSVVMSLVPMNEQLYADVSIKNEDVGFVQVGQKVQMKLAAFPFQKYGMLAGTVLRISADANDVGQGMHSGAGNEDASHEMAYKARVQLDRQVLVNPQGQGLPLTAGMQVVSEIHQGRRTVLEYLLSPVQKVVQEAGRER